MNQTVIFSDTALTEVSWGNVVPTMALKSVFTTKAAMCSGVPSGFWVRWTALTSCCHGSLSIGESRWGTAFAI